MHSSKTRKEKDFQLSTILLYWIPPVITAVLGLFAGIVLSTYNSGISDNRYFLEKRTIAADSIAKEFSRYVVNWNRLIQLRKHFDTKMTEPLKEEKKNFQLCVFNRNDARDKLFTSFDAVYLYFSEDTIDIVSKFRDWDTKQSILTIDQLPEIKEWNVWQKKILRKLHEEITK